MSIADAKYVVLTTYRTSGEPVSSPVWVVPVSDGRIGHLTSIGSGKTDRLGDDPRVSLQPSNARGAAADRIAAQSGTAELVRSGRLFDEVRRAIRAKYGFQDRLAEWMARARLGPIGSKGLTYGDTVVLVRLDDAPGDGQANSD